MTGSSRVRSGATLLFAAVGTSCGPPATREVLTVEQLDPRIDELNGRTVSVAGYLPRCGGYTCVLYRTKEDADATDRAIAAVHANQPSEWPEVPSIGIGMGTDFDFDPKAAPFTPGYVVITGTITNECRFEGKPACTDRGTDLKPSAIRAGTPPAH